MEVFKKIYVECWKSEYLILKDDEYFYLSPTEKTNFNIFVATNFERLKNKYVIRFSSLLNFERKMEEVEDIIEFKNSLYYVIKDEENNRYLFYPAIGYVF